MNRDYLTIRKQHKIFEIIYVIYMFFVFNIPNSIFYTSDLNIFVLIMAFFSFVVFILNVFHSNRIKKSKLRDANSFVVPMGFITLVSIFTSIHIHHAAIRPDTTQSLFRFIMYAASFIVAMQSITWFGKKALILYLLSGCISYFTVIIKYIAYGGIYGITHIFNYEVNGVTLEVNNFTYVCALCFIYYLLSNQYTKKQKKKILPLLFINIILGDKRAIYFAMLVTFFVYFLFHKQKEKHLVILRITFILYIVSAFVYLFLIKFGGFSLLLQKFNIDDMSRLKFWNYFQNSYDLAPSYWGRGISYTDNIMGMKSTIDEMQITIYTNIHNDILRAYIGFGFIPFLYYFINFFLLRVKQFQRIGKSDVGWKYYAVASYYFFIMFFDNMFTAPNFNIAFFMVYLMLEHYEDNKELRVGNIKYE